MVRGHQNALAELADREMLMAAKRTWDPRAELRALNYMVRILITTHSGRAKLAAEIGKATVSVESAMLGTLTADHLLD